MRHLTYIILLFFYLIEIKAQDLNICTSHRPEFLPANSILEKLNKNILFINVLEPMLKHSPLSDTILPMHFKDWSHNKEYTKWRFELKPNIAFHYNEVFTPSRHLNVHDVFFSWSMARHPEKYQAPWVKSPSFLDNIAEITNKTDLVFTVVLKTPDADFINKLKSAQSIMYSKEYFEILLKKNKKELFWAWPISTGPYMLGASMASDKMVLKRFPHYHLGKTSIEKINITYELSGQKRANLFAIKQCDIVTKLASYEIKDFEQNNHYKIIADSPPQKLWLYLNIHHSFFSDITNRQWFLSKLKTAPINQSYLGAWANVPSYLLQYEYLSSLDFKEGRNINDPMEVLVRRELFPTQFFKHNLPLIFSSTFPGINFKFTYLSHDEIQKRLTQTNHAMAIDEGVSIDPGTFVKNHSGSQCKKNLFFPLCFSSELISASHSESENRAFTQLMSKDDKGKIELTALMLPLTHMERFSIHHDYVEKIKATVFNGLDLSLVKKRIK